MKRVAVAVAAVLAVAASSVGVALASGGPTVIAEGFRCEIIGGDGDFFVTYESELIEYASGKLVQRCTGYGPPARRLTYYSFDNTGEKCLISLIDGLTFDWIAKVGRNGHSQQTCTFDSD